MIDFGELSAEVGGDMSMDRLHCEWMLSVLRVLEPRCVIEIGCHMGVSTTAIVQAYDEGCVDELHLIDVNLRPGVLNVLRETKRPCPARNSPRGRSSCRG